jgi:hypothetical protein
VEATDAAARAETGLDIGRPRRVGQPVGRSPEPRVPEPSPDAVEPPVDGSGVVGGADGGTEDGWAGAGEVDGAPGKEGCGGGANCWCACPTI